MATATAAPSLPATLAEFVDQLGGIPLDRILIKPPMGTATENDVVAALEAPRKRVCELIDGVLVEKALGAAESNLAGQVLQHLNNFLDENDLGMSFGADGPFSMAGLVRLPDVSFVPWERLPDREPPKDPIPNVTPTLAVEVLSEGNTKKEIERKIKEYFEAGVELVWIIHPKTQTAEVYTSPTESRKVGKTQALDGGSVLPGFRLPLQVIFSRGGRRTKPK
ncbi:MAG: Uma2 family endonuclease [Gemmataceae bacterium]|nr:Uma2 family endonuclease [Gemmataceae bacterium]